MSPAVTRDYLAATRPLIERTIGRPLRQAEQIVDVFHLTRLLDQAKDDIETAISREQKRAISRGLSTGQRIRLELTGPMIAPVDRLYRLGKAEALLELERLGVDVTRRSYSTQRHDPDRHDRIQQLIDRMNTSLGAFSVRVESERVELHLDQNGPVGEALATALLKVLGARSIAADVVSTALFTGIGQTFDDNQDLIGGWEVTAVLDGGTCDECESHDGDTFDSWDAAQELLPDGGPAVYCLGGDRCRCRLVPSSSA